MALLSKFFGRTASEGAAFALGTAVGPALSPAVQELRNEAWGTFPTRPLGVADLANGVSSGQIPRDWATNEARNTGYDSNRFGHLVSAFDTGPGVAFAYELWHRGILDVAGFRRALKRESLEDEWIDALVAAREVLLSPADLAAMRQQGYIGADYQHAEAAKQGVTAERADLMFEAAGLPPGYGELAQMLHRGIITEAEFVQAIREANTKVKYTDELLALSHPLLAAAVLVNRRLRGYDAPAEFHSKMAQYGYTATQADEWFEASGRPLAPQQMLDLIARKGPSPSGGVFDFGDFRQGIVESDIKPKYATPAAALYHKYPPLFQLRRAVESGGMTKVRAAEIMHIERYEQQDIDSMLASWKVTTDAAGSGYTDKAKTQLWTTAHRSYVAFESNKTQAGAALARLGVPTAERADVLALWDAERDLIRRQLTPAQVKKAYLKPVRNPLTGANWTRDDALAALLERGYSTADANTFLDE